MPPFSAFHAPMSIPWIDIAIETAGRISTIRFADRRWRLPSKVVRRELRNRDLLAVSQGTIARGSPR
jgi:hypothetical protein